MKKLLGLAILIVLTRSALPSQQGAYWNTVHLAVWEHGDIPADSIPWRYITHLIHFSGETYGKLTNAGVPGYYQAPSNYEDAYGQRLHSLAAQYGVKLLIDLGFNQSNQYTNVCALGLPAMETWASTVAHYIVQYGYDGADFDCEGGSYPANGGMGKMAQLLHDTLAALDPVKKFYITTSMMPNGGDVVGYGVAAYIAYFDQVNDMWYDQCFPNNAPLFPSTAHPCWGTDSSVAAAYEHVGVPKSKIGLGYPIQVYDGCPKCYALFSQVIQYFPGSTVFWDDEAKGRWFVGNGHTIQYEDTLTGWWKADFVKRKGYGGVMGFCLGRGYLPNPPAGWLRNPAVQGIGRALIGSLPPPPPPSMGRITGRSFFDTDSDGVRDPSEPGLPLWRIRLRGILPTDTTTYTVLTNSSGYYSFDGLPKGTYQVSKDRVPSSSDSIFGWRQTYPSQPTEYVVVIASDTGGAVCDFGVVGPAIRPMSAGKYWNLLSIPLNVSDARRASVFQLTNSEAWRYDGSYLRSATISPGTGYWTRYASAQNWMLIGSPLSTDTIPLREGWNLIGSVSQPVSAAGLLSANPFLVSRFIGYRGGTGFSDEDSVEPGRGYWVKASQAGTLILSPSFNVPGTTRSSSSDLPLVNSLTFASNTGDVQTLYFSADSGKGVHNAAFALPPPMDGVFDARFSVGPSRTSGTLVDVVDLTQMRSLDVPVHLQSIEYPLSISWEIRDPGLHVEMELTSHEGFRLEGRGQRSVQLDPALPDGGVERSVMLKLSTGSNPRLPSAFELLQNFPDPFNPNTAIQFLLPENSFVQLDVFNVLGRKVATLVDNLVEAGSHSITFDGSKLSSGVYFYEMHARSSTGEEFTSVRQMVLLR
jgi:hypothetical protein